MYEISDSSFCDGTIELKKIYVEAKPEFGFYNPYIIYLPEVIKNNVLMVSPVNTGKVANSLNEAREHNLLQANKMNYNIKVASDLGMPLLIPLFPRFRGYNVQSFTREVFCNDISRLLESYTKATSEYSLDEIEIEELKLVTYDIPEQFINIVHDAGKLLSDLDVSVSDKFIIDGYSAASKFSNLITALYPNNVLACICGGNTGLGIIPNDNFNGNILKFSLGTADIPNFDFEAFSKVPQLYYIGEKDYNDPALIKCKFEEDIDGQPIRDEEGYYIPVKDKNDEVIPILDKDGDVLPYYDLYSKQEIRLIYHLLGKNPQVRFENQKKLYQHYGINAQFIKLPGGHKTIFSHWTENHNSLPENLIEKFIWEQLDLTKKK